ncbi:unnamed protein product [Somion occarium]|uniref:Uncharacterized protein n=1 Tax=Somion occarium TaxID=3059160 RepID=A0ABP1CPC5_9APHY
MRYIIRLSSERMDIASRVLVVQPKILYLIRPSINACCDSRVRSFGTPLPLLRLSITDKRCCAAHHQRFDAIGAITDSRGLLSTFIHGNPFVAVVDDSLSP